MEGQLVAFHLEPILQADSTVKLGVDLNLIQVYNRTAARANKVTVGRGDSVKPLLPLYHADALHVAVLLEKNQIAVNSAQTEIGVGGLQGLIDPFGRRVTMRAADNV